MNRSTDSTLPPSPHFNPTLQKIADKDLPKPLPACATCPSSICHSMPARLQCYCSRMHLMTWHPKEEPILQYDGREMTVAELLQEMQGN